MIKNRLLVFLAVLLSLGPSGHAADDAFVRDINLAAAQRSFFVPGWGQWHKGYPARGVTLGVLEVSALTGAYYSFQKSKDAEKDFRNGKAPYSRHTKKVDLTNFLLITAGAVWGYSFLDAYLGKPAPHLVVMTGEKDRPVLLAYQVRF